MKTPRDNFAVAATNNAIYALGGRPRASFSALSSVEWAVVKPDGSLGDWQPANPMTSGHSDFAALVVGNYLYALGGDMNGGTGVERAAIGTDGSLGVWQPMSPMTTARSDFAAVAVQGYMYALGGAGSSSASSVERAQINADGSLGTWELISRMTTPRARLNVVATHGYIYALGGTPAVICSNTVERAELKLDGSLGSWEKVASMRLPRCGFGAVVVADTLLVLGGEEDALPSDRVERARIVTYTHRIYLALIVR
jgi:N-acetylneuraminic acid mutarotase